MEMRGVFGRVAAAPDIADNLSTLDAVALVQVDRIAVEMCVVVAKETGRVELVDRQPSGLAREELLDVAVFHGKDWRSARGHDVERLVRAPAAPVEKCVVQVTRL